MKLCSDVNFVNRFLPEGYFCTAHSSFSAGYAVGQQWLQPSPHAEGHEGWMHVKLASQTDVDGVYNMFIHIYICVDR